MYGCHVQSRVVSTGSVSQHSTPPHYALGTDSGIAIYGKVLQQLYWLLHRALLPPPLVILQLPDIHVICTMLLWKRQVVYH